MATEKNFENRIKKYLKDNGAWFLKYWAGAAYTKSGIPDILACVNGYFVAIEVKAPNGKPSELQLYNLREIEKAGGFAFLLYPNNWIAFKEFMENEVINKRFKEIKDAGMIESYEQIKGW